MFIESLMPSSHLILCRTLLPPSVFPKIRVFQMSQFASGGHNIGVSTSPSVLAFQKHVESPLLVFSGSTKSEIIF